MLSLEGNHKAAEAIQEVVLKGKRAEFGPNHLATAYSMALLGEEKLALGKLDEAEPLFKDALKIRVENREKVRGIHIVETRDSLAQICEGRGDLKGARKWRMDGAPDEMCCGHNRVSDPSTFRMYLSY